MKKLRLTCHFNMMSNGLNWFRISFIPEFAFIRSQDEDGVLCSIEFAFLLWHFEINMWFE